MQPVSTRPYSSIPSTDFCASTNKNKMNLFGNDPIANVLPFDGTVNYHGQVISDDEAQRYYDTLLHGIPWKNDETIIFGKHIVTARKVAWYGDYTYSYTYSGTTKRALLWTAELHTLKSIVERCTASKFNSCLLNLYHDGNEGMAWHSDDEKSLGRNTAIASISFGAERKFCFKHKRSQQTITITLEHGSLLVMKDATQTNWLHSLPKSKKIKTPRINLTFRTIVLY
jgi:alkylated DNA repair dioxygenase AlkB